METQEVLDLLAQLQADVEWEQSIAFAAALDVAMKRVKDWDRLKAEINEFKSGIKRSSKTGRGSIIGLSYIEGCMAEMENEDVACNTDGTERSK